MRNNYFLMRFFWLDWYDEVIMVDDVVVRDFFCCFVLIRSVFFYRMLGIDWVCFIFLCWFEWFLMWDWEEKVWFIFWDGGVLDYVFGEIVEMSCICVVECDEVILEYLEKG